MFSGTEFAEQLRIESGDFSSSAFSSTTGRSLTFSGSVVVDRSSFQSIASNINFEGGACRGCKFLSVSENGQVNLSATDLTGADLTGLPLRSGVSFVSSGAKLDWAVINEVQAAHLYELNSRRPRDVSLRAFDFEVSAESFVLVVSENPAAVGSEVEPKYVLVGALDNRTNSAETAASNRGEACKKFGTKKMLEELGIRAAAVCSD